MIAAYQAPLLRYAARLLHNATLAQDVVQNTLVKLSRRQPPPEQPGDEVRNWLFKVAHNEAVDLIRAEERKRRLLTRYAAERESEENSTRVFDTGLNEQEALVLDCLPVLSPLQRQVVLLRLQQGLSYEAIADIVGEKSGYVGNLLHHAVRQLAVEVRRREKGAPPCARSKIA